MKKLLIIAMSITIASCSSADIKINIRDKNLANSKVRIAILPFKSNNANKMSGEIVSNAIVNQIIKISNWDIVERMQIDKIMKVISSDSGYSKAGKLSGANYLIIGSVTDFSTSFRFLQNPKIRIRYKFRIINTMSGIVVGTVSYSIQIKERISVIDLIRSFYTPIDEIIDRNIKIEVNDGAKELIDELKDRLKNIKQ